MQHGEEGHGSMRDGERSHRYNSNGCCCGEGALGRAPLFLSRTSCSGRAIKNRAGRRRCDSHEADLREIA